MIAKEQFELLVSLRKLEIFDDESLAVLEKFLDYKQDQIDRLKANAMDVETMLVELETKTAMNSEQISQNHKQVMSAFPNSDTYGHSEWHQAKIDAAKAEKIFWTELKREVAQKGFLGLIKIMVGLAVVGLTVKITGNTIDISGWFK